MLVLHIVHVGHTGMLEMHYTSVLVHVSCCGNMHMRISSTTLT